MHLLVTAGVTQIAIDKVRAITSIFTGRTGTRIAIAANRRGHAVTLLTSAPHLVGEQLSSRSAWQVHTFRSYEELERLLEQLVPTAGFDAIIHSAAVSDYRVAGIYVPAPGHATFHGELTPAAPAPPQATPANSESNPQDHAISCGPTSSASGTSWWPTTEVLGKLPSSYPEVWLRLVPTAKLIDRVRRDWGFGGVLVKFKLESGVAEETLLARAEESRQRSAADLMVANLLESVATTAWLGPVQGQYRRLSRSQLADALLDAVESLLAQRGRRW